MKDIQQALLDALLGFIRATLEQLVREARASAERLLVGLLPEGAPTPEQIQKLAAKLEEAPNPIAQHLEAAGAAAGRFATAIDDGVTRETAEQALAELATALGEIEAAIDEVATVVQPVATVSTPLLAMVRGAIDEVGETAGGLLAELEVAAEDFKTANGIVQEGQVFTYEVSNPSERPLPALSPAELRIRDSRLVASLDFGAVPPRLQATLTTGASVGLLSDSLVAALAAGAEVGAEVDLELTLDSAEGLTFGGGARQRISLPVKFEVPSLDLRELGLELPQLPDPETKPAFELSGDLVGSLGPVTAVVQGAGVRIAIDTERLLAGEADLIEVAVRAPHGAGLSLDAAAVSGGGLLARSGTEYSGALELRAGPVDVAAVGLVETEPFSMAAVLGAEFHPAVQLSFGFTLNAVGGIVAINRGLDTDKLRARMAEGTLDALLFPSDPVASAPTVLAGLREVLPEREGGFVIGPTFKLGWGSPVPLLTAKLGVLVALPDPTVVAIGALRLAVPTPDAAVVDLRAALYGEISSEAVLITARLDGSRIAGYPLAGDFGFYASFGERPQVALSAGGFHPAYSDRPPDLASLKRLSVDLSPPAIFSLSAQAYVALTSNSFQLGARVDLRAVVGPVGAEGHIQFDALVLWSPRFAFVAEISAKVALQAFGQTFCAVGLRLQLEGPGPWKAQGTASVSLLFFDVELDAGPVVWGEGTSLPAAPVSPQELVHAALSDPGAWLGRLPAGGEEAVRLVPAGEEERRLVHPLGSFEARQKAVPLETAIDRVGRHPASERRVNLGQPELGGVPVAAVSETTDLFAPGEFLDLSEDEKLSMPGFRELPSGLRLAPGAGRAHGSPLAAESSWHTVYPGQDLQPPAPVPLFLPRQLRATALALAPATRAMTASNPYLATPEPEVPA